MTDQNGNAAMTALARALAPALAEELAPLLGLAVGQRYVHEHDEDLVERTGVTPRALADACRAGKVEGAVRTPKRGWRATEAAIAQWLEDRRARRRKPPREPEPAPAPPDDLELLAGARTRGGPVDRQRPGDVAREPSRKARGSSRGAPAAANEAGGAR